MLSENMEKSFIGDHNIDVRVINLYFEAVQKRYDFEINDSLNPVLGEFCIVETARGLEMGKVYTKASYVKSDTFILFVSLLYYFLIIQIHFSITRTVIIRNEHQIT